MKMTPADYDAVAKIFATASEKADKGELSSRQKVFDYIAIEMSSLFEKNNPNFSPKRFLEACKVI